MGSADFSQFVVTTAVETACETSTLKVHALSPHLPATFTGTSSNFWTSSLLADLSVFPSLICGSCTSGQGFAYSFLQIPPHDGHPCCSAIHFPLPGHVQDFHLRERAHGAQTKRAPQGARIKMNRDDFCHPCSFLYPLFFRYFFILYLYSSSRFCILLSPIIRVDVL